MIPYRSISDDSLSPPFKNKFIQLLLAFLKNTKDSKNVKYIVHPLEP